MDQQKTRFKVIMKTITTQWDGSQTVEESRLGETYAVSKAQAINNIRHRCGVRETSEYLYGDGSRVTRFEAIPI